MLEYLKIASVIKIIFCDKLDCFAEKFEICVQNILNWYVW